MDKQKDRETDRQADGCMDGWTDKRQTDGGTDGQTDGMMDRRTDRFEMHSICIKSWRRKISATFVKKNRNGLICVFCVQWRQYRLHLVSRISSSGRRWIGPAEDFFQCSSDQDRTKKGCRAQPMNREVEQPCNRMPAPKGQELGSILTTKQTDTML